MKNRTCTYNYVYRALRIPQKATERTGSNLTRQIAEMSMDTTRKFVYYQINQRSGERNKVGQ